MKPFSGSVLLDLETTGLSKEQDSIVCLGLYCVESGQLVQYIQSDTQSEQALLLEVYTHLEHSSTLYVYQNFDLDFFMARLLSHDIDISFLHQLKVIPLHKTPFVRRLRECGYTTRAQLEEALGYVRTSQTTGRDLAKLGKLYLEQVNPTYEAVLKTHNQDELQSLARLYGLYRLILSLDSLQLEGTKKADRILLEYPLPASHFWHCTLDLGTFVLEVLPDQHRLRITFKAQLLPLRRYLYPAKDYMYIPSEGQLIHKSIAQFFPSSMKEKVSQANCFLSQEHIAISLLHQSKAQLSQWIDEAYNVYMPLSEVSDFLLIHQKVYKYLTQG